MQALPSIASPSLPSARPGLGGALAAGVQAPIASLVPDGAGRVSAITARPVAPVGQPIAPRAYDAGMQVGRIQHPLQAPSAVASENALMSRALMAPLYVHDSAASRMARLSNPMRDAPRFGAAVNLLA